MRSTETDINMGPPDKPEDSRDVKRAMRALRGGWLGRKG